MRTSVVTLFAFALAPAEPADPLACRKFKDIYTNGKDLCENIFDGAFKYETDLDRAYTMWWFSDQNENDKVTARLFPNLPLPLTTCNLRYWHLDAPVVQTGNYTECHPWKQNSCCKAQTVQSSKQINDNYGEEYHWDRCGPVSEACSRFFVFESCLYECDVNAGLFRKYPKATYNASDPSQNEWEMAGMPIRADVCDSWYTACAEDKFCSLGGGSFFSCAKIYKPPKSADRKLADWLRGLIATIAMGGAVFLCLRPRQPKAVPLRHEGHAPSVEKTKPIAPTVEKTKPIAPAVEKTKPVVVPLRQEEPASNVGAKETEKTEKTKPMAVSLRQEEPAPSVGAKEKTT